MAKKRTKAQAKRKRITYPPVSLSFNLEGMDEATRTLAMVMGNVLVSAAHGECAFSLTEGKADVSREDRPRPAVGLLGRAAADRGDSAQGSAEARQRCGEADRGGGGALTGAH